MRSKNALIVILIRTHKKAIYQNKTIFIIFCKICRLIYNALKILFNNENSIQFFIGGGTPSLFSAESIAYLLKEKKKQIDFEDNIEITLEANPGTVEAERFKGYVSAGIMRISMGIQSFNDDKLQRLGRIHNAAEAKVRSI